VRLLYQKYAKKNIINMALGMDQPILLDCQREVYQIREGAIPQTAVLLPPLVAVAR
jgi:hypothetical protein